MSIHKTYFAEFAGIQQDSAGVDNAVMFKNVHNIFGERSPSIITFSLSPYLTRVIKLLRLGDPVIFRLRYDNPHTVPKFECLYILPYWYTIISATRWDNIINELQSQK